MKTLVFADSLVGGANLNYMPLEIYKKWQDDRVISLRDALDDAEANEVDLVVVAGGLFGNNFVPQPYVDAASEVLSEYGGRIVYYPFAEELDGAVKRMRLPQSLTVLSEPSDVEDSGISITHDQGRSVAMFNMGDATETCALSPLEPLGFGSLSDSGYYIVCSDGGAVTSFEEVNHALHPFVSRSVVFDNPDSTMEMSRLVMASIEDIEERACMRISLRGRVPLHVIFDASSMAHSLKNRCFYLEIADESEISDEENLAEEKISLLGEFLRIVKSDDSLSRTEKARIIRCGCRALAGRRVVQ